ncbi:uncharacterized protein PSFLO_03058 [Pseudozyma flocculosa]|uniref:Telomere length regulation protein conserved domain-containing protein n=2 Tax=Pseudozyma flocculosa TaxID=84751 RepID=A0A5C3EZ78_9BASI|nr:uncharacterized protein PSFLO_03058 [Pseudozyma flocculosa]
MMHLASSASFLDGVSCHLEHADPHVRRTGMLVAEIVSAKSKAGASTSKAEAKALNFGRAVWDGIGQGKEEARVLRALHDAWPTHCRVIDQHLQPLKPVEALDRCLQAFGLGSTNEVSPAIRLQNAAATLASEPRAAPRTVRLPVLQPPPPRSSAPAATGKARSRPLITPLSDDESQGKDDQPLQMFSSPRKGPRSALRQRHADRVSDSSSGDDNSSDDDDDDAGDGRRDEQGQRDEVTRLAADLSGMAHDEAAKLTRTAGLDGSSPSVAADAFDATREAHAPDFTRKKGLRPPVYINELAPLLKSDDRASIKLGLKSCAALVRRKAGWGGEVEENAVDLAFALCGLHNNLSIRRLDERRTEALAALFVACPRTVGGCLTEQFFNHQYSMVQKLSMLNALAQGAMELSGRTASSFGAGADAGFGAVAETMTHAAIDRARQEGEKHVPAIQRSKNLSIGQPTSRRGAMVTPIASSSSMSTSASGAAVRAAAAAAMQQRNDFARLAPQVVPSLLLRFSAHLADFQERRARRRAGGYAGINVSGLFSPTLVSALFDTLAVLVDLSTGSDQFRTTLSSTTLETCLAVLCDPVAFSPSSSSYRTSSSSKSGGILGGDHDNGEGDGARDSGRTRIHASAFALALIVLDRNAQQDACATLSSRAPHLVEALANVAETTFTLAESRRRAADGTAANRAVGSDEARLARSCAAILLVLDEVREKRQAELRQRLGVVGF